MPVLPAGVRLVGGFYILPDGTRLPAIRGGAFIPLAMALAPLLPSLISSVTSIVKAVSADPMTPEQLATVLNRHGSTLETIADEVAAVEIRDLPGDPPPTQ